MPVSTSAKPRPGRPKGARTREAILHVAVNLASLEGLQGLTIGRLADELKMSKSGLFAHFGSKEELQLATVEAARQIFIEHVIRPALVEPEGMPRLWALCERWLGHVESEVFAGGCFFTSASFEFDSRAGTVRDRIAEAMQHWLDVLSEAVARAQRAGHMQPEINPNQLAFELYSLAIGAYWRHGLFDDKRAFANGGSMILSRIRSVATPDCPAMEETGLAASRLREPRVAPPKKTTKIRTGSPGRAKPLPAQAHRHVPKQET